MLMGGEFESIRGDLAGIGITLNTLSRDEHVSDAERRIRIVKERSRCMFNALPFKKIPAQMAVQMVCSANFWLNVFPPEDGVSEMNPQELVTGLETDCEKRCQLEQGTCVQTRDKHDNSMTPRTTGAVAMRPTGDAQGGCWFCSLTAGRLLNRNHWTALPMPADVTQQVHQLAKSTAPGLRFADRLNRERGDDDCEPDAEANDDDVSLGGSFAGVDEDELADLNNDPNNGEDNAGNAPDPPTDKNNNNQQDIPAQGEDQDLGTEDASNERELDPDDDNIDVADDGDDVADEQNANDPNAEQCRRSRR
mgnify:CR=1 FL=1